MACLIFVNKSYKDKRLVKKLIAYATSKNGQLVEYFGGFCVDGSNPRQMIYQFNAVKEAYDKTNETHRQLRHFILSFSKEDMVSPLNASMIAYEVAWYYAYQYQIVYGVHENTDNVHIHFIINTVSYVDGHLFTESISEQDLFHEYVNRVLQRFSGGRIVLLNLKRKMGMQIKVVDFSSIED